MTFRLRTFLLVLAIGALAAVPTLASSPASGKVSFAAPSISWTGSAPGYGYYPVHGIGQAGEPCQAPACDSFTLTVEDVGNLTLTADNGKGTGPGSDSVEMDVTKPDGTTIYTQSAADAPVTVKIKAAPKGDYTVAIITNDNASGGAFQASASLVNPAAPAPAPSGTPGASPTPPGSAPAPAPGTPAATLTLKTKKASAKKSKKGIKLAVSTSKPVDNLVATLFKGKKALGKGTLAKLDASGTVVVKVKKLKKGAYTIALDAKDRSSGQAVGLRKAFKVTK